MGEVGGNDDPMPWGERRKPPWTPIGAVGTGERGLGWAFVQSSNQAERLALARALVNLGWRVECPGEKECELGPGPNGFALVFCDVPAVIRTWAGGGHPWARPEFVAIVDDRDESVQEAHDAGADWYMVRPINLNDPLGVVNGGP